MPPQPKITKAMILDTVLSITREKGFEAVNARSIAQKLQCSTRPIFTCYKNMDELKKEFLDRAFAFYSEYVVHYKESYNNISSLIFPLSYIDFASQETFLFKLLFIHDMDLNMKTIDDFYSEIGNKEKAQEFSSMIGVSFEHGKKIFIDLFLYSHGIAVLTAANKISLDKECLENMMKNMLMALTAQKHNADVTPEGSLCQ